MDDLQDAVSKLNDALNNLWGFEDRHWVTRVDPIIINTLMDAQNHAFSLLPPK